jgi:hypothetical protein
MIAMISKIIMFEAVELPLEIVFEVFGLVGEVEFLFQSFGKELHSFLRVFGS